MRRDYPLDGGVPGWYFRVNETSNGAWTAEACDAWGRKVACSGSAPEPLLRRCARDAAAIVAGLEVEAATTTATSCRNCDEYHVTLEIRTRGELDRILAKVGAAVRAGRLASVGDPSDGDEMDVPDIASMDANGALPDLVRYHVVCTLCARSFALECETYHGAGGRWRPGRPSGAAASD